VLVVEGAAGSLFSPGRLTQVAIAHDDPDCPLADGSVDEALSRLATLDRAFNEETR
jgi:hypothetical protein